MQPVWWVLTIIAWLLSATVSWMLLTTLSMFNAIYDPYPHTQLFLGAPVIALVALGVAALFRRKAAWLPAVLLASPALQIVSLLWANLDKII